MPNLFSFSSDFIERELRYVYLGRVGNTIYCYYKGKLICYFDLENLAVHKVIELERRQMFIYHYAFGINRFVIEKLERIYKLILEFVVHVKERGRELLELRFPYKLFKENRRLIEYEEQQYKFDLNILLPEAEFYKLLEEARSKGKIVIEWYYEKGRLKKEIKK